MVDSVPMAYELLVGPLTRAEKDRYCGEAATIAPLLGIPHGFLPQTIEAHETYMEQMFASGQIAVSANARTLARGLLTPPLGAVGAPLFSFVRLTAIGLLPPGIRQAYGFRWHHRDEHALGRRVTLVKHVRRRLPRALREWPAARKAS
jgi:uncharacterized protein (DUF2236 family)